jgi:hypothetical protein
VRVLSPDQTRQLKQTCSSPVYIFSSFLSLTSLLRTTAILRQSLFIIGALPDGVGDLFVLSFRVSFIFRTVLVYVLLT